MILFGLGISAWYLSNRILAGDRAPTPVRAQAIAAAPPVEAADPVEPLEEDSEDTATVVPPELDLAVAALGGAQDAKYMAKLQAKGYECRLNTSENGMLILIGPYPDERARSKAQQRLAAAGILATEAAR